MRKTGGLADAVQLYERGSGQGNGIVFDNANADGMRWALGYAMDLWRDRPAWDQMVQNGMRRDFSWETPGEGLRRAVPAARPPLA